MAAKKPRTKKEMKEIQKLAGVKIRPVKVAPALTSAERGAIQSEALGGSSKPLEAASQALTGELLPKGTAIDNFGKKINKGGRPPGRVNKITKEVKDVILRCFYDIGGREAFAAWAKVNQTKFYQLYSKLLPIQLQTKGSNEVHIHLSKDEAGL